jgi:hypothetical protein
MHHLLLLNAQTKYPRLRIRKMIFTVRAKGGAPSGQSWPRSTTRFRIRRIINKARFIPIEIRKNSHKMTTWAVLPYFAESSSKNL